MPGQPITLHVLTQHLDGGLLLAEPLLLDGVAVCHDDAAKVAQDVERLAAEAAGRVEPMDWHRIVLPAAPELGAVTVELEPPKKQPAWTKPVSLTARYVRWRHGTDAVVGYFPALGIEVIAEGPEAFDRVAPGHVLMALKRTGAGASLYRIAQLRRSGDLELSTAEAVVDIRTPKQRHADQKDEDEQKKRPVIEQVGRVLTAEPMDPAYEVDDVVARLADALAGRTPTSVLLVGPAGVGKTAAFRELVRRRSEFGLAATPFWGTSGARLVAGQTGFGMWQERCARLCREAAKHRAVVHLGSLVELMEVGQSEMVSQGIATFLKPFVARGDLLAVAECTPEQLSVVERRDPGLLEVFRVVRVEEPSAEAGRRIIARRVAALGKGMIALTDAALAAVDRLHRRYAGYSAFPARPLGFVRNLVDDRFAVLRDGKPPPPGWGLIDVAAVTAAFAKQTGLPAFLLDDAVPYDRAAARDRFASRVIGQGEAVDLVADLIATVKAGLSRPRRPVASLLFIGPTGVGKTELAKALAEFFFGSADRMARFDMSEFGTPVDVQRLVGGVFGGEGLLTARVREEPFSVLLLDEIEKAHPLLFDLLLQVLGEGRLTDAAGRVADFTNAVVVMTSNLGAEGFGRGSFGLGGAAAGRPAGELDARAHFTEAVREFLRPEMFNRIDRIVPFLPLDPATVERIVRRELDLVALRDGVFLRRVQFAPGDDVVRHLATRGYDRAFGARPLKRLIERELLVPLGDGVNAYGDDVRLRAEVGVAGDRLAVSVRAVASNEAADGTTEAAAIAGWAEAARAASRLRRRAQQLQRSTAVLAARNELTSLHEHQRRAEKEAARRKEPVKYDAERARRIARLESVDARAQAALAGLTDLEERALLGVYERGGPATAADAAAVSTALASVSAELDDLLLAVHGLRYPEPDKATLAVYGRRRHEVGELTRAYAKLAEAMARPDGPPAELRAWWLERKTVKRKDEDGKEYEAEVLFPNPARSPYELFVDPPAAAEGLMLAVVAPHAQARLSTEAGVHVFAVHRKEDQTLVEVSERSPSKYEPSDAAMARDPFDGVPKRRTYHLDRAVAKDERLARELRWGARGIAEAVEAGFDDAVAAVRQEVLSEAAAATPKDGQFPDDDIPF